MKPLTISLLAALMLLSACQSAEDGGRSRAADRAIEESREALDATGRYLNQERENLQAGMDEALDDLNRKIDELQGQTTPAANDRRKDLEEARSALRRMQETAKDAGRDAWDDIKNAWRDLEGNIDRQLGDNR